ncbi:hypothetical protein D3C71_2071650 [compost metagenome]
MQLTTIEVLEELTGDIVDSVGHRTDERIITVSGVQKNSRFTHVDDIAKERLASFFYRIRQNQF